MYRSYLYGPLTEKKQDDTPKLSSMHQQMSSTLERMKQPHRDDNWFKDSRLMHLNPQFAFDVKIK